MKNMLSSFFDALALKAQGERGLSSADHLKLGEQFTAHNYSPLKVVLSRGQGAWVWDVEGKQYLDMLAGYGGVNFGHCNPRFMRCAVEQLGRITLTSRAFYSDQIGPFCKELAEFCGLDLVLPMNSGAEAIETAIKAARRWGYQVKGIPEDRAKIICLTGNFAGRTTTIVSFSSVAAYRAGFGPFTPGFVLAPYGDFAALEALVDQDTAAVLVEPVQGEGGIIIPPAGYLRQIRELCDARRMLLIDDEVQTGLCRTGAVFAVEHEAVKPDLLVLGKSLGAGITPISAVVGTREAMEVFTPGSHGSTFGGNPFACAIAREVLAYIREERPHERAVELGAYLQEQLSAIKSSKVREVRGRGLMIGIDIDSAYGPASKVCYALKDCGVLTKDTREQTIRFTPPLTISREQIDWAMPRIRSVL